MKEKRKTKKINVNEKIEKLILRAYRYYLQGLEDLKKADYSEDLKDFKDLKYLSKACGLFYLAVKFILQSVSYKKYKELEIFHFRHDIINFIRKDGYILEQDRDKRIEDFMLMYRIFHVYGYYNQEVSKHDLDKAIELLYYYILKAWQNLLKRSKEELEFYENEFRSKKKAIELTQEK
jgi:hypothetical protein